MSDVIDSIRPLEDKEINIIMNRREVKRAFDYLTEQLKGHVEPYVYLDTNNYRTFFSHFIFNKEYSYRLTWNEALRLHSYLRFYIERKKKHDLSITMAQIRNFPLYGLNVKDAKECQ